MLKLTYKHRILKAEHWDELNQAEFIELFRRINAPWYEIGSRLELSQWIYNNQISHKFLVKKIKLKRLKLYGPSEGFRDMTSGEFLFADTYYFTYLNNEDPALLDKFIASIFRERKAWFRFSKKRIDFDEDLINPRAKLLENLPQEIKQAILFNYGAVRGDIIKPLKSLFPQRKSDPKPFKKDGSVAKKKIPVPQWEKWMWDLAAGNTDQDFDKVANMLVRNFLKRIDTLIKESKKK
jgi:hypothetical protein